MTLGERIKELRRKNGFSQEKIAELVGISRQAVTKWEAGQSAPSMANLLALAELFGVSLDELTGGVSDAIPNENTVDAQDTGIAEKKKGAVSLTLAILLSMIGIMTVTIVSNMNSLTIVRLAGVHFHEAQLVRLGLHLGGGMAIFAAIVLFVLYVKGLK